MGVLAQSACHFLSADFDVHHPELLQQPESGLHLFHSARSSPVMSMWTTGRERLKIMQELLSAPLRCLRFF